MQNKFCFPKFCSSQPQCIIHSSFTLSPITQLVCASGGKHTKCFLLANLTKSGVIFSFTTKQATHTPMVLNFVVGMFHCQRGKEKKKKKRQAEQPVQLKSMEIFPGTSGKLNVGTRSVKMAGNGPWRTPRQAALNWIGNKWETKCKWLPVGL